MISGPTTNSPENAPRPAGLDDRHSLEDWLGTWPFRMLLRRLSREGKDGTALERIIRSYRDPAAPASLKARYWLLHRFIDRFRGEATVESFRQRLSQHAPTLRGLVIVARSVAEFGLTQPQKFSAPLFAVWNITNQCNLRCKHCYQSSQERKLPDELNTDERLAVVDQLGKGYVPMLAIAGGEPTICPDLLPVLRRAQQYHMHTTIATNGVTMTQKLADELVDAGVRYVEISLDSVHAQRHDAFRGRNGLWEQSVAGMKIVAGTQGLRLGVAMCVHQGNYSEVREMIEMAISLGAGCFAHFNFIPVGRGLKMVSGDITPDQREALLEMLNGYMQRGSIGVISTAPQLGRACLMHAMSEGGRTSCSHAGSGSGAKARVVARYLGGCGAGRTYICVEPNGDVTPCVYLPHRVMGNLRRLSLQEVFRGPGSSYDMFNDRAARTDHCGKCDYANFCGGCRARSDAYFGRLDGGDPGCVFNRAQWDELVASGVAVSQAERADEDFDLTPTRHGPA